MKKLILLLLLLVPMLAQAYDAEIDGIYYNFKNGKAEVTYLYKHSTNQYTYSGTVTIPASVTYNNQSYPVTSIGDFAFNCCSSLTSITIHDGITSIGRYAFENCSALTNITIPDGVTSIGSYAFVNCSGLTNITIPDGVTSISEGTFGACI